MGHEAQREFSWPRSDGETPLSGCPPVPKPPGEQVQVCPLHPQPLSEGHRPGRVQAAPPGTRAAGEDGPEVGGAASAQGRAWREEHRKSGFTQEPPALIRLSLVCVLSSPMLGQILHPGSGRGSHRVEGSPPPSPPRLAGF